MVQNLSFVTTRCGDNYLRRLQALHERTEYCACQERGILDVALRVVLD